MNQTRRPKPARRQLGASFVELLIAAAVSVVAVGSGVPGFKASMERRHLDGAAAQLETDLQFARSLAAAHNRTLRLSFRSDVAGSCYIVHTGAASDCQCTSDGAAACTGGATAHRVVRYEGASAVRLSSNVTSMTLDGDKGTVSPTGTVKLQGAQGSEVRVVVNIMGRVRSCTPTVSLRGYPSC